MSVNGKVIPCTPLAVDFWQVRKCPGTRLFFLSHMHSDHTVGLTSTWSDRPIYCSPVTARLLQLRLKVKEQWIHPLELGEPHLLPLDDIGKETMTVTLIDANHCPGAVMFLFEGYFGSILYTGDFRYTPSMLREPGLRTNITIDVLYLDNTNCDPNRPLPSRKTATQQIKEIIRSHPDYIVIIGLYTLGKESLLVELALEFKSWVEVSVERMETLKALDLPDVFITEPGAGRFRVVDQSQISAASIKQWNKQEPTLAILPTSRPLVSYHPNVHIVPYSDHSSYQELEDFVSAIKPTSIVPILGHCVPSGLCALLPHKKRHEFLVPESVRLYMSRQNDNQLSSSGFTNVRRKLLPLPPKGVIFESPEKGPILIGDGDWQSESTQLSDDDDEDMDTDGSDTNSLIIDLSKKSVPIKNKSPNEGLWSLNIVQTVSEEVAISESMPFSQFSQGNYVPMMILTNPKVSLKPGGETARVREINAKIINEEMDRDQQYGDDIDTSSHTTNRESMSQQNDVDSDSEGSSPSQHNVFSFNHINSERSMRNCNNNGVSSNQKMFRQQYLEEVEDALLQDLPFSEEDLTCLPLFDRSLLQICAHSQSEVLGSSCAS